MTLRLNGATSGFTEIDAPAVAGSNTLTLPGGNGSADQALVTNGSGTLSFADRGRMVLETAQSASSTEVDFTSIPSWVKRVTVMFNGVSISGTAHQLIQLGAGSITTSGYTAGSNYLTGGVNSGAVTSTAGMPIFTGSNANVNTGHIVFTPISGNTWVCSGLCLLENTSFIYTGGKITLSGTLDRIRITTTNGTDTFDAGTINLLLEG